MDVDVKAKIEASLTQYCRVSHGPYFTFIYPHSFHSGVFCPFIVTDTYILLLPP